MKTTPIILASTLCLLLPHLAHSGAGTSGGGSSLKGELLDTAAKKNTINFAADEELITKIGFFQLALASSLTDLQTKFNDFVFEGESGRKSRFILVDALPPAQENDVRHDMADKLVGLQRGPVIWVLRDFYNRAKTDEKLDFVIHEFLVNEKLKKGPLSLRDREEVLNVTAMFSEKFQQTDFSKSEPRKIGDMDFTVFPGWEKSAKELQSTLVANHFEPGLTLSEFKKVSAISDKLNAALEKACSIENPDPSEFKKALIIYNYLLGIANNEIDVEISKPFSAFWASIMADFEKSLKGKRDQESFCAAWVELDLEEKFEKSLNLEPPKPQAPQSQGKLVEPQEIAPAQAAGIMGAQ